MAKGSKGDNKPCAPIKTTSESINARVSPEGPKIGKGGGKK
jgi:hypothetical protein